MVIVLAILGAVSGAYRDLLSRAAGFPATWHSVGIAIAVSLFTNVAFIVLYDSGHLPFTTNAPVAVLANRQLAVVYRNVSNSNMLVTVSATNKANAGNRMLASVAADPRQLADKQGKVVGVASFAEPGFASAMTFLVPGGQWYVVTTDGGVVQPEA
jgi:hypothetical protein